MGLVQGLIRVKLGLKLHWRTLISILLLCSSVPNSFVSSDDDDSDDDNDVYMCMFVPWCA